MRNKTLLQIMPQTCNPSVLEAKARGSHQVPGHLGHIAWQSTLQPNPQKARQEYLKFKANLSYTQDPVYKNQNLIMGLSMQSHELLPYEIK